MPHRSPPGPRRQLVLVAFFAAASIAALLVAHPRTAGASWSRGDDVALMVAWAVAITASAWLFVVTGACVAALGCSRPRLARRLAPALPVGVRRLVEIAIVTSCIALPALPAQASVTPRASAVAADDQPVVRAPDAPAPVGRTHTTPPPTVAPKAVEQRVVVRAGDSLWLIARAALARTSARSPGDADVAHYWRAVIAANRSTLRSGDPSLIFPGEMVTLPVRPAVS